MVWTHRIRLVLAASTVALALSGCLFPGRQPGPVPGEAGSFRPKTVQAKEPPNILIAIDGTRCSVSADRYESTNEGDVAWCWWR